MSPRESPEIPAPVVGLLFGNSLFDDFFEPTQRFPLYAQNTIEVLPLPEKDRPASFDGAVGIFSMEVFTDLQETLAGEPIMYSIRLAGKGNFDRIQAPELTDSPDWKFYSPQAVMEESDEETYIKTKRFDYVMTPQRAGSLKTPAIEFTYFDPKSANYITLKSPPIPITVKPSERAFIPLVNVANNKIEEESNGPALSRPLTREETLTTLDYQPRMKAFADEEHPFRSKGFLTLQATLLLLISTTAVFLRRRVQLKEDPKRALAQSAQKASRKAYNQAMSATTVAEFYQAALSAVRHAATARTKEDQSNATFNQLHTDQKSGEKSGSN